MATPRSSQTPTFFESGNDFRSWLEVHAATETELVVGFYKVGSGRPSLTWPESVDEALCFGWIDGVRTRIDDQSYKIRFTPRRSGSTWSAVNVAKVKALISQGRMQPAGLVAFAKRTDGNTAIYSFEQAEAPELGAEEIRAFKKNRQAWLYFESAAPSYKRAVTHWVVSAKQAATRQRRLAQLIESCADGKRLQK